MKTILLYGNILADGDVRRNHYLLITNGKIHAIVPRKPRTDPRRTEVYSCEGKTIVPGFVDLHIHGVGDFDLFSGDPERLLDMGRHLARFGVTGFLPTLCTAGQSDTLKAIRSIVAAARRPQRGARILGINLEGPFINPEKAGAQDRAHIARPDTALLRKFIGASDGFLKIVTLAPEMPGAGGLIRTLREAGVIASIGHSNAGYAEGCEALRQGVTYATHLGNAMHPMHHRDPGAAAACMLDHRAYTEVIADGVHLHPAFVKMAAALKGDDRLIVVTDSLCGVPDRESGHLFGGRTMFALKDRYAYQDGVIAGSRLTMNSALRNLIDFTGKSIVESVKYVGLNALKAVGSAKRKGLIKVGYDADITVIDKNFNVAMTVVEGQVVYKRSGKLV